MAKVAKRRRRYVLDYYDHQGKRQRKTLKKGTTLKQAKDELRQIEDQLSKGIYISPSAIPTFEKVAEDWLKYKKPNIRSSTWSVYEGHTRVHFEDIKHLKINRVTIKTVEQWIADRQKAKMNISTLRKILVTFNQILAYAVRHQYIAYNPLRDAERPRKQGGQNESNHKVRVLNPKEIGALIGAVESPKYKVLFKLAIMSGARQGELLGLKWSDVDWENSQIHIQRTFNNQAWYDVKTDTSRRKIDLGPSTMAELKKWFLACPPNRLNLVFPNEADQPLNHNNLVSRYFNPALEKAKIERIRFHDLRHTYASLLIEQGENIKYIQNQLGHSSPTVTLNVYAHLMKKVNQEAACRLEKTVFNA
jgi:integrase